MPGQRIDRTIVNLGGALVWVLLWEMRCTTEIAWFEGDASLG